MRDFTTYSTQPGAVWQGTANVTYVPDVYQLYKHLALRADPGFPFVAYVVQEHASSSVF